MPDYKRLYEAQKREHEKTWEKLRRAQKDAELWRMSHEGAMTDLDETVAVMRKHLVAMVQYLELNYPKGK